MRKSNWFWLLFLFISVFLSVYQFRLIQEREIEVDTSEDAPADNGESWQIDDDGFQDIFTWVEDMDPELISRSADTQTEGNRGYVNVGGLSNVIIDMDYDTKFIFPHNPVGGGNTGGEKTAYADNDGWYCYDDRGRRWPSNGECD